MSLADELLNDLEEEDDNFGTDIKVEVKDEPMDDSEVFKVPLPVSIKTKLKSVKDVAKLWDSPKLRNIKSEIEKFAAINRTVDDLKVPVESDPEYRLIVEANNVFNDINNEIGIIHKFVKEKYSKRFPELESLVVDSFEYLKAVKELGNDVDKIKNSEALSQILTQATIMVVSVAASTTQGELLEDKDLIYIDEACSMAQELNAFRLTIFEYVESRMSFIAPNLSAVVGASTAAKLMGGAGGLTNLAKMPADYVMLIGKQKRTQIGMSRSSMLPHTGFIYYSDIVQEMPPEFRMKAARIVSAKATLASRVDSQHGSPRGEMGEAFREDIEKKLDKMTEPPPVKGIKPLPLPVEQPGKRRGGKRVRKMKERMAVTDFRKVQNRMSFGDIEEDAYQEDLGYTRGQIGKGGSGKIRKVTVDEKTRVRLSKTLQKEVQRQNTLGGASTVRRQVAGTASSVAFTPLQGLEIVNPNAAEQSSVTNSNKYFSNVLGFKNVKS